MAEKQSHHRQEIESKIIESDIIVEKRGQIFGLTIGLTGLTCSTLLGIFGNPWAAGILGGSTILGLVGAFIYGKHIIANQMQKKTEEEA